MIRLRRYHRDGVTLVELLVVIAIIAILIDCLVGAGRPEDPRRGGPDAVAEHK